MRAASLTLLAAGLALALPAHAESVAPLDWTPCGASVATSDNVAARTECARLVVPRDYAHPDAGTLGLDVVRVIASGERGARHDGVLLLEPDEFSGATAASVTATAASWLDGGSGWRDVATRLDLIGLAPRRMADADGHDCLSATSALPRHVFLGADTTDANVARAEGLARAIATVCQNDPMSKYIGTHPRIKDIERLREALGRSRLHLLGTGRGGWVAARYAERYPDKVGRLILDSSWDIDGSVVEAMEARVHERGRMARGSITPVVADAHADPYGFGQRSVGATPAEVASAFAARCNDGFWGKNKRYWRERTRELRTLWPSSVGNETFQGMVCSEWPSAFGNSTVPFLDRVPSFLMLHAEFDTEAPLRNAAMGLNAHLNAKMVVARGTRGHGLAVRHDLACVSDAASRFLADGVLPGDKLTNCWIPVPQTAP